jgi:hypothetical protein
MKKPVGDTNSVETNLHCWGHTVAEYFQMKRLKVTGLKKMSTSLFFEHT